MQTFRLSSETAIFESKALSVFFGILRLLKISQGHDIRPNCCHCILLQESTLRTLDVLVYSKFVGLHEVADTFEAMAKILGFGTGDS